MTRQELYDLVWSAPMAAIAEQLGISGKTINKRCQIHGIPTPPRGYWTRVAIDRAPSRPPLEGNADDVIRTAAAPAATRPAPASPPAPQQATSYAPASDAPSQHLGAAPPVDTNLLQCLASELHTYRLMTDLVDSVASRALTLRPEEAATIVRWASATRRELEQAHPATRLIRVIQAGCV